MATVLVTGATGHLGNVLVRELIKCGQNVRVLVHPSDDLRALQMLPIEVFYSDVRDDFSDALSGVETLFHLASIISITPSRKKQLYSVNVGGTENVISLAKRYRIPLIYVSSVHAFSEMGKGSTITEETPIDENRTIGDYAKSKAMATKLVFDAFNEGMDGFIIFPTGIFGPYDFKNSYFSNVMRKYHEGKLRMTVKGKFDFVDVRDLVLGIIELYKQFITAGQNGLVNGEGFIISGNDIYFEELPRLCGLSDYRVLGDSLADFVSYISLLGTYFSIPAEFVPYALHTIRLDCKFSHDKVTKLTNYAPREVEESVKDFFNWLNV